MWILSWNFFEGSTCETGSDEIYKGIVLGKFVDAIKFSQHRH
jgi:hypothetical protein